jgi:hypothetical protein
MPYRAQRVTNQTNQPGNDAADSGTDDVDSSNSLIHSPQREHQGTDERDDDTIGRRTNQHESTCRMDKQHAQAVGHESPGTDGTVDPVGAEDGSLFADRSQSDADVANSAVHGSEGASPDLHTNGKTKLMNVSITNDSANWWDVREHVFELLTSLVDSGFTFEIRAGELHVEPMPDDSILDERLSRLPRSGEDGRSYFRRSDRASRGCENLAARCRTR